MSRKLFNLTLCFLTAVYFSVAHSKTVDRNSANVNVIFGDQIEAADAVVIATVFGHRNHVIPGLSNELNTLLILNNVQQLTSEGTRNVGGNLVLRIWGGVTPNDDGSLTTKIPGGTPEFDIGERLMLFLSRNGNSRLPLVGIERGLGVVRIRAEDVLLNQHYVQILGILNDQIVYESSFNQCDLEDAPQSIFEIIESDGTPIRVDESEAQSLQVVFTCPNGKGSYIRGNDRPDTLSQHITLSEFTTYISEYMRNANVPYIRNLHSIFNPSLDKPLDVRNTDEQLNSLDNWLRKAVDQDKSNMIPPGLLEDFTRREQVRRRSPRR